MLCKIADLIVEVPAEGGLDSRCGDYLYSGQEPAEIVIRPEFLHADGYPKGVSAELIAYLESGWYFAYKLLDHDGIFLHASAVALDGKAYLFSADSGTGKSTHTGLWQQVFGARAQIINDDKPALRCLDGVWYAYGTPWCGKDGINQNRKVPLAGICFLKRGSENRIRTLNSTEAIARMMPQTMHRFSKQESLVKMLTQMDKLLTVIPAFELECLPDEAAAKLSYETMSRKAEEMGL